MRKLQPKLMQDGLGRHDPFWSQMSRFVYGVADDHSVSITTDDVEREVRYIIFRVRRTIEYDVSRRRRGWDYRRG